MATDLTVRLRSVQPGETPGWRRPSGPADVNIDGFAEEGLVHVLVEDSPAAAARQALAAAGLEVAYEHPVGPTNYARARSISAQA